MTKRWGDGDGKPRVERPIGVAHGEAFQLMLYLEKDEGPHRLWFWNSRDGVTPFGTTIDGVEYRHAMHGYQTRYTAILPPEAQMVWVDYTPDAWREMLHRRWEGFRDHPATEFHDPVAFLARWPTPDGFEAVQPYEQGSPMHLTREQFLESTHSWHGRVSEPEVVG